MDPPALKNRPEPSKYNQWDYDTFSELSNDRRILAGAGPLPLTTGEIRTYYESFNISEHFSFEEFYEKMRMIDSIWLEKVHEEKEKPKKVEKPAAAAIKPPRYNRKR